MLWDRVQDDRARAGRRALFNGPVFSADTITPDRITGHWTEYRRVLAQMQHCALFDTLRIRSLAVTGLLQCADGLILGRRETDSVYQAGIWQSPPAGSVERRASTSDRERRASTSGRERRASTSSRERRTSPAQAEGHEAVDLAEQLLAECEEELGLPAEAVRILQPVAAIEHPGSHIVDVAFLMRTALGFEEVEHLWRAHGNREYDQLRHIDLHAAHAAGAPADMALLPTTKVLFAHWLRRGIL